MTKKLPLLCASLATAGLITALSLADQKEQLRAPADAETAVAAVQQLSMTKLGHTKSIPMRAPAGGYTAPVTFAPTQEQFNECTIIDVNEDGRKWIFEDGYFRATYNYSGGADDWCILPTMNLEAGAYKVSYTYKTRSDLENFRIMMGQSTDPESMTIQVVEKLNITSTKDVTETRTVDIPTAGEWHFGLYHFSDANKFYVYIKDVSIVKLDANQPKAPALSAQTDGLDCSLTVTLPSETVGGEALPVSEVIAKISVDGELLDNGTVTGAPGEVKTVDFTSTSGTRVISATSTITLDGETIVSEANSIDVKFTKRQTLPTPMGYVFTPDADEFEWCTVINANGDMNTWEFTEAGLPSSGKVGDGCFRYSYSFINKADDWIILPAFDGAEAGARRLTFNVGTKYGKENLEVCVGYEPTLAGLSQNVVWKAEELTTGDKFVECEALFPIEGGRDFYVAFRCTSTTSGSYLYVQNISVDKTDGSAPVAPILSDAAFDGGDGSVSLTLPSKNLDGNALTAAKVYADITLDGEPYGDVVEGAPGQTIPVEFSDLALGAHNVTATAYILGDNGEKVGNQQASLDFRCTLSSSFAYDLPLSLPLNSSVFDYFVVINANEDAKTWTGQSEYFELGYTSNPGDDWFITPAVNFTKAGHYDIAVTVQSSSASYEEAFEVWMGQGQNVAAMTKPVMERTTIKQDAWKEFETTVEVTEPGRYNIGVHGVSAANMYNLRFKQLDIKESNVSADTPAAVSDLAAEGLETGALEADVTFTFPTLTVSGTEIPSDTELTATVASTTETKTVTGKPGAEASLRIGCPNGDSEITVFVSSEAGDGARVSVSVNCGLDRPTAPVITGLTISEDNMSVKIDYQAITTGVNGGHVNASGMDYYLWEWDEDDEDWYQIDVTDALTMTYELYYSDEPLTMLTLGLQAYNGLNSGSAMTAFNVILGVPETLPVTETFEEGQLHYLITLGSSYESQYAPQWGLADPSQVIPGVYSQEGGYALYGHTSFNMGDSFIYLPKFSTEGMDDAEIEISSYHHPSSCELTMMAAGHGMDEYTILGKVEIPQTTDGWQKSKFTLPASLQGRKWVDARLHVNFTSGSYSVPLIDSYVIRSAKQSGVADVAEAAVAGNVEGKDGHILVTGFAGETARVFAPAGQQLASALLGADATTISVAPGIYLVTIGDKTFKVAVR